MAVSQPPLGWLHIRCYAHVTGISEEDKHLSLPYKYGYRLVIGCFGVVKGRGWELSELSWWVWGSWFVIRYTGLHYKKLSLVWLASRWGRLLPRFPHGATPTPGVCQGGKTGLVLGEILNFSFGLVFWHIGCRLSMVYWYINEPLCGWRTGRVWQPLTFWVCVLFINLCRVKGVHFVVRILDAHHLICNVCYYVKHWYSACKCSRLFWIRRFYYAC